MKNFIVSMNYIVRKERFCSYYIAEKKIQLSLRNCTKTCLKLDIHIKRYNINGLLDIEATRALK